MKRLFLYTVSALLLSAVLLFLNACGKSNSNDAFCSEFGVDKSGPACKLYSQDQVCCDETTCTLTQDGEEYICKNPDASKCADVWLDQLCPDATAAERVEFVAMLSAKTRVLMSEARRTSLFCH